MMNDPSEYPYQLDASYVQMMDDEWGDVDHNLYIYMIGSLIYITRFRLDIILEFILVGIFQSTTKQIHLLPTNRY